MPEMAFLMIEGQIEKGASPDTSPGFAEAMAALGAHASAAARTMPAARIAAPSTVGQGV